MITAFIFDMDGVVCNNIPFHKKAWIKFMKHYGFIYSKKFFDTQINGKTNKEILTKLFGKNISREKINKYASEKEKFYRQIYSPDIKPLPGLITFLKKLKKQKHQIALATSAPAENVKFVLEKTKTKKYFSKIVDAKNLKHGKPHPEIFLKTAKKLNTKPANCVVFEDSMLGVKAGKRAGMKVIGILSTCSKKELHLADKFAKNFVKIPQLSL